MDRSIDSKGAKLSRKIPSYLKLHKEELSSAPSPQDEVDIPHWSTLQDSFAEATGWKLDLFGPESETQTPCPRSLTPTDVVLTRGTEKSEPRVSKDVAHRLAESVSGLVDQLQHSLNTVWQREAELAAGIPVCERTDEDEHLANRLESVLKAGANSVGCAAAALYLLDDATSELKLRACWGMPTSRLLDPPRPLRGAVADLEALIGHAVVLQDTQLLPHWKTPEQYAAAVCLPVASPSTPLGTAWFFANETRGFSDQETQILEVIAGRLAADLEREVLLAEGSQSAQMNRELHQASQWQEDRLPNVLPMIDDWQISGWAEMGG